MTTLDLKTLPDREISCSSCSANCCRLEVLLISETGVPDRFIQWDQWGSMTMKRLDDGWCAALNRDNMKCSIYSQRPLICREFAMGGPECIDERAIDL